MPTQSSWLQICYMQKRLPKRVGSLKGTHRALTVSHKAYTPICMSLVYSLAASSVTAQLSSHLVAAGIVPGMELADGPRHVKRNGAGGRAR